MRMLATFPQGVATENGYQQVNRLPAYTRM